MKYILIFFSALCFLLPGLYAESLHYLTKDQIILTDNGIFFFNNGQPIATPSVKYEGNGMYAVSFYGQCKRCGYALNEYGRCTNENCYQYGPRRD